MIAEKDCVDIKVGRDDRRWLAATTTPLSTRRAATSSSPTRSHSSVVVEEHINPFPDLYHPFQVTYTVR